MSAKIGKISKTPDLKVNIHRTLEEEEVLEINSAMEKIHALLEYSNYFNTVSLNYTDYQETISNCLKAQAERDIAFLQKEPLVEINRIVLNFLTSFRSYLDYTERRLKTEYANTPKIYEAFRKATNSEYDHNFSYRFLYHLRHFSQHYGFPIAKVNFGFKPNSNLEPVYFFTPLVERNKLLQNFNWKKLKPEIETLPLEFDLEPHLNATMHSLLKIHSAAMQSIFSMLGKEADTLLKYEGELRGKEGTTVIFTIDTLESKEGTRQLTHKSLPTDMATKIKMGDFTGLFPSAHHE